MRGEPRVVGERGRVERESGEGRRSGELHDGTKTFTNCFLPFRDTNSLVNPFLGPD